MNARTLLLGLSLLATLEACEPVSLCQGRDGGNLIDALEVSSAGEPARLVASGVSMTLKVTATVPCLVSGTRVSLSTSRGSIGDAGPGEQLIVPLAITEVTDRITRLEGYAELIAPPGTEHVLVSWNGYSRLGHIEVPALDAGAAEVDAGTSDAGP